MKIDVIVVPYDSGQRAARLGLGPMSLIENGLLQRLRDEGHDVAVDVIETLVEYATEATVAFDLARNLAGRVRQARTAGRFPLVLAGNCMAALGVVAGIRETSTAVVWLDAHGDFNTPETTRTAFLDGMAAAVLAGWCWTAAAGSVPGFKPSAESTMALIGARDLDPGEQALLARSKVTVLAPAAVKERDRSAAALRALPLSGHSVYLHIDLDVLDPDEVGPANCYAAPGGLTVDDVRHVIDVLARSHGIDAVTLSAYDPDFDRSGAVREAAMAIALALASAKHLDQRPGLIRA